MKYIVQVLLVTVVLTARGQNFDQYKTIISAAPIPKDFTERSFVKVAAETRSSAGMKASARRVRSRFYMESTFSIDDFLTSGSVLFNDQVTVYLQKVLDEIVRPYPDLKGRVRVYTVKSSVVNAFTTNNGIIFVNLGLLARLENEAQLAFVLAHEVVHYHKQHVLNAYITSLDIEKRQGSYRNISIEERAFAKSSYSKELESEADASGADIFLKSNYSTDSVDRVFDVLKFGDFPMPLLKFDKRVFESGKYVFHDSLVVRTVNETIADDDYDDSRSSHPNGRKRKEAVLSKFLSKKTGKHAVVSAHDFAIVRKIAQYELCREYLLDHDFLQGLNMSLLLYSSNRDSDYVLESMGKSLYGIAKQKLQDRFEFSSEEWRGESVKLGEFINKLTTYETSVLALRVLSRCQENDPANQGIDLMLRDLLSHMNREENIASRFSEDASENANEEPSYTRFAFADLKNPTRVFQLMDEEAELTKGEKATRKSDRSADAKGQGSFNKIVVVNPKYRKIDRRKRQRMRHIEAEKIVIDMNQKIHASAGRLNIMSEILNTNTLTPTEVRTMQSNSILADWLREQFKSGDDRMISPIHNEVIDVARLHKTDYFLWLGCASLVQKQRGRVFWVASSLVLPSISPLTAAKIFTPKGRTFYFALLFNVRSQQLELSDIRSMSMKDSASLLESNIYYTLFKVKGLLME